MNRKTLLFVLCACLFAHAGASPNFACLPLRFQPSRDPSEHTCGDHAKFLARGNGYTLYLTDSGAILRTRSAAIRMQMAGGNPSPSITPQGPLPGMTNYLIGNDPSRWRTGVAGFARVNYREIYPGIDLIYYGNQEQLEYDFVVAPGADPRQIQIVFGGTKNLKVDRNGDLVMRASGQPLRFRKPLLYQDVHGEKRPVTGHYTLSGRQVGFAVSSYDPALPLVIDPVLVYSTFLGDPIYAIATDAAGNAYAASSPGVYAKSCDSAVTKINAAGTALIYSTFFGGGGYCALPFGIAVDSAGNAYVTGTTQSPGFPTVNPIQSALRGAANAFVFKLNAAGSAFVYSTYLGGSGTLAGLNGAAGDSGNAIAVDSAGNAYVAGRTDSPDFPTVAPFQAALHGQEAAFVAKINATGSALVYSTYLGGTLQKSGSKAFDLAVGIAVDSTGNAYVTGDACSVDFPTVNPIQATNKSVCNVFITKLNPSGSTVAYSTYLGGSTDCCTGFQSAGIAVDSAGNAYVAGTTASTDFPVVNAFQPTFSGVGTNAFAAKLNASGSALIYSTYLGSSAGASAIAVDSQENAYIAGGVGGTLPLIQPIQAAPSSSGGSGFIAELSAAGSALVFSTYFGSQAMTVAVDSVGIPIFRERASPWPTRSKQQGVRISPRSVPRMP